MANKKVIVVGAGMAGLAAAYRLRNAGVDVTVLESSDHVGGRLGTDSRDGYMIERGAQLITSTYRNALELVKELGLESELKPTSPWMAIVKDGRPRRMPSGAMFPIYASSSSRRCRRSKFAMTASSCSYRTNRCAPTMSCSQRRLRSRRGSIAAVTRLNAG
jgi:protoporphyrinogen oxidase